VEVSVLISVVVVDTVVVVMTGVGENEEEQNDCTNGCVPYDVKDKYGAASHEIASMFIPEDTTYLQSSRISQLQRKALKPS
jgi:hypothetical protein